MILKDLDTPGVVVDMDKLEKNIVEMSALAEKGRVELWPMIKTHKSAYILGLQLKHGAKGILVAKPGEAEVMAAAGATDIILAYPVIGEIKLARLISLARKARIICSVDTPEAAEHLSRAVVKAGITLDCLIIIDSGLRRLGVTSEAVRDFYQQIRELPGLRLVGVATHGGHVYGAADEEDVQKAAKEEVKAVTEAAAILTSLDVRCDFVAIGTTPTVKALRDFSGLKQIRPGNYVFYDATQVALGVVSAERCALSVIATVISVPEPGRAIIDAGSKIMGLDAGAHGNTNMQGHGLVKGHNVTIKALSEELGRVIYEPKKTELKVGQRLEIIPNHACTVVNMVDTLYGVRNGQIIKEITVDARGMVQ
jgi:D-serine deaminase-like pyridoxal phosphate-dependent protein